MVRILGHSTCDDLYILRPCDIDVPHMYFMKSRVEISKVVILLGKVTGNCKNMSRHVKGVYFMFGTHANSLGVRYTMYNVRKSDISDLKLTFRVYIYEKLIFYQPYRTCKHPQTLGTDCKSPKSHRYMICDVNMT